MKFNAPTHAEAVAELCPACGMCCNGVLFGDVELQREDDPKRLKTLGLELFRKGRKLTFRQPCRCWQGGCCRIYSERPARCRAFDCALLKRVEQGGINVANALKLINAAKRDADNLEELVRAMGNADVSIPLNERYAEVMKQPLELASKSQARQRRRLMRSVARLAARLLRDFLPRIENQRSRDAGNGCA